MKLHDEIKAVLDGESEGCIVQGDCLEVMADMPDGCVDAVVTDPPYFKVKGEPWDNQWDTPCEFLRWLGRVVEQWARLLRPNGSLYCFASPQMAARVECLIAERMNVLNHIVWDKPGPVHALKYGGGRFRQYVQKSERIIFAEHYGADNMAGFLRRTRIEAGLSTSDVERMILGKATALCYRWEASDSAISREHFDLFLKHVAWGGQFGRCEKRHADQLWNAYHRPFSVSPDVPYTDVWTFEPVRAYKGKHPCEKPHDMLRHIIEASSRPGAVVLDSFVGTGSTGIACGEDRKFIGIELSEKYCRIARNRVKNTERPLFTGGGE